MITASYITCKRVRLSSIISLSAGLLVAIYLSGCTDGVWNSPYPKQLEQGKTLYSSFSERPKHLDPAKSYSANEYAFIAQIYEPPFQYHFLKRPYELIPATAIDMPQLQYFNEHDVEVELAELAKYSVYTIRIQAGIDYQPHPAFAKNSQGQYYYHDLNAVSYTHLTLPTNREV